MSRVRKFHGVSAVALGGTLTALCVGACVDDRAKFEHRERIFEVDASLAEQDGQVCSNQCSLDGRSVIDTCTGAIVEACPADLACGAGTCQEPCAAAAADRSSNGCEFYFQMPRMDKAYVSGSCGAAFIVNTSTQPANISLEREGKEIDISRSLFRTTPGTAALVPQTGPVGPGESVILFVSDAPGTFSLSYVACPVGVTPATTDDMVPHRTGIGASFRVKSNVPLALTSVFPFGGAASYFPTTTLVLPVASWAKEHMLVNGWGTGIGGVPAVQIVASEDDTEVTILPKVDIQDGSGVVGGLAHEKATYRLARGQILQIVQEEELTGSILTSNKPTAVFGGNTCGNIPSDVPACDVLSQQIPPFEQWGSEYVGVGYRPRTGNEHEPVPYRIVAARDGTRLEYDPALPPGAPVELNAGEVAAFRYGTGDAFVVRTQDSEHPIYVSAHMTGGRGAPPSIPDYSGWGDPEFVNVIPTEQYLNSYSFFADPSYKETSLVIVRKKRRGEFKDVWLECAGNLQQWNAIGTRGEYEFTRVDLRRNWQAGDTFGEGDAKSVCDAGLHRMRSDGPFTATLWGWDSFASYAYPSGMAQRRLVNTPVAPVN